MKRQIPNVPAEEREKLQEGIEPRPTEVNGNRFMLILYSIWVTTLLLMALILIAIQIWAMNLLQEHLDNCYNLN